MLCHRCGGSGKYLGNGMMMTDCRICDELGEVKVEIRTLPYIGNEPPCKEPMKIDRRSQSYKDSIKEIMRIHPTISRDEAVIMFDEAYDKV